MGRDRRRSPDGPKRSREKSIHVWLDETDAAEGKALQIFDEYTDRLGSRKAVITQALLRLGDVDPNDLYVGVNPMMRQIMSMTQGLWEEIADLRGALANMPAGYTPVEGQKAIENAVVKLNKTEQSISSMFRMFSDDEE